MSRNTGFTLKGFVRASESHVEQMITSCMGSEFHIEFKVVEMNHLGEVVYTGLILVYPRGDEREVQFTPDTDDEGDLQ